MDEGEEEVRPPSSDLARARRRRGGEYKPKALPRMQNNMADLLKVVVKQLIINTKATRELKGAVLTTILVDASHAMPAAIESENKAYARAVREAGPGHGLGPVAASAFLAMVEALAQLDVGMASTKALTALVEELNAMPQNQMQDEVPICRLERTYKKDKCKVIFMVRAASTREAVVRALMNIEMAPQVGAAPPGYLEDELAMWLAALEGGE